MCQTTQEDLCAKAFLHFVRLADILCACTQCCAIPHVLATHLHTCPATALTGLLLVRFVCLRV